jgi:hypothetical protein
MVFCKQEEGMAGLIWRKIGTNGGLL